MQYSTVQYRTCLYSASGGGGQYSTGFCLFFFLKQSDFCRGSSPFPNISSVMFTASEVLQDNPVIPFIMFTYALLPRKVYFINFVTLYTGKFSLCVVSWSSPVQQWQWCDHRPVPEVQWLSVLTLPCPAAFLLNCYDKTLLLLHFNTGRNFCFSSFVFHWRYIINCSCCNERTHRQICWKYIT